MATPDHIHQQIQKRMQEIDTYRTHSLFKEARILCRQLAAFVREEDGIANRQELLHSLSAKLKAIESELKAFDSFSSTVEMTPKVQSVVHRLFTSGKGGKGSSAFESATALLVFGQRAAAMKAFTELLEDDAQRIAAAKSIIRCYLGNDKVQQAVNQYLTWFTDKQFPPRQLESVRQFLQAVLTKKGIREKLPVPSAPHEVALDAVTESVTPDYISIVLPYVGKGLRKKQIMLDVNFQRGKMINCIVSKIEKDFIGFLKSGTVFPDVQINASNMISFCAVRLSEVGQIVEGRLKGDTTVTMEVLDDANAPPPPKRR